MQYKRSEIFATLESERLRQRRVAERVASAARGYLDKHHRRRQLGTTRIDGVRVVDLGHGFFQVQVDVWYQPVRGGGHRSDVIKIGREIVQDAVHDRLQWQVVRFEQTKHPRTEW